MGLQQLGQAPQGQAPCRSVSVSGKNHRQRLLAPTPALAQRTIHAHQILRHALIQDRALLGGEGLQHVLAGAGEGALVAERFLAPVRAPRLDRWQAVDGVALGHGHLVEPAPCIRRDRLQIAPLGLRVQRAQRQRRLARAGYAAKHHQRIARDLDIDILQIVLARSAHPHIASNWAWPMALAPESERGMVGSLGQIPSASPIRHPRYVRQRTRNARSTQLVTTCQFNVVQSVLPSLAVM